MRLCVLDRLGSIDRQFNLRGDLGFGLVAFVPRGDGRRLSDLTSEQIFVIVEVTSEDVLLVIKVASEEVFLVVKVTSEEVLLVIKVTGLKVIFKVTGLDFLIEEASLEILIIEEASLKLDVIVSKAARRNVGVVMCRCRVRSGSVKSNSSENDGGFGSDHF